MASGAIALQNPAYSSSSTIKTSSLKEEVFVLREQPLLFSSVFDYSSKSFWLINREFCKDFAIKRNI